jgi:hypothetical protein
MQSRMFEKLGGVCAGLAGLAGFAYSTAFVIYLHNGSRNAVYVDSIPLVLGGLVGVAAFVAVYGRVRGYDLANLVQAAGRARG